MLAAEPQAMQLRYFAALHDIASERSSTIVFPLPTDLLAHLGGASERQTVAAVAPQVSKTAARKLGCPAWVPSVPEAPARMLGALRRLPPLDEQVPAAPLTAVLEHPSPSARDSCRIE